MKDRSESLSAKRRSLAAMHPRQSPWINLALLSALVLLGLGIFAPLLTVQRFYIFDNTLSLASGLAQLARERELVLFVVIGLFSVVFPVAKIVVLYLVWNRGGGEPARHRRHLHAIAHYGKWSMLDVFVVALLLVSLKLGAIARVQVHFGLYAFAASVLLTMVVTARVVSLSGRLEAQAQRRTHAP